MPNPICFMVMPYRTRDTGAIPPAPAKVDFDALWEKALVPVIEDLGYQPVRADQDLGGLIIKDMLERLYFSDLVLADSTIPNGNVYYEVGVRHAMRQRGCVLLGAEWSRGLFDLDQVRRAEYPLPEGEITNATAAHIRAVLATSIPAFAEGETPVFQALEGYPGTVRADCASAVRGHLNDLAAFQATVRAVRDAPAKERKERALALRRAFAPDQVKLPSMALELIHTLRDFADWSDLLAYMDGLPASIRELPILREQRCLAQSKAGDHVAAIAALNELISTSGDSSERQGLLGGRYKRLYREAADAADRPRYLSKAVEHYERGMMLDLNDYFPACNLPPLYLVRGRRGDEERARAAAAVARLACQRSIERGADDEWTRPTLLGLAFVEGDLDAVNELCDQVSADGAALWKLASTLDDLEDITRLTRAPAKRKRLEMALDRLRSLAHG